MTYKVTHRLLQPTQFFQVVTSRTINRRLTRVMRGGWIAHADSVNRPKEARLIADADRILDRTSRKFDRNCDSVRQRIRLCL